MGCGASNDPKIAVSDPAKNNNNYSQSNGNYNNNKSSRNNNGFQKVELRNTNHQQDSYNKINNVTGRPDSDKKPLAFVIEFDEKKKSGVITNRPPPGRLQLDPISKGPGVTQEKLDEKMRAAERNRENILKGRVKSSKNRSSEQSRNNSGSGRSSYYNNDSRKMSREFDRDNNYNSNSEYNQNNFPRSLANNNRNESPNYEYERKEEDERKRQRLLNRRRIVQNQASDNDEIEHDKNYRNDDDYF